MSKLTIVILGLGLASMTAAAFAQEHRSMESSRNAQLQRIPAITIL